MSLDIPIFNFHHHTIGGTEYQGRMFHEKILPNSPNFQNYLCMILPGKNLDNHSVERFDGEILFWAHCLPSQFGPEVTEFFWSGGEITDKIKYVIVPSEYAKDKFNKETGFPKEKLYVIPNGIEPLKYNPDKFRKMYLDNEVMHDDRITFYGRTPRKTMYRYLEDSHLQAYPPIFLETFCIAMAEAMSAGLLPVYTNVGSLPEVIKGHGLYLDDVDNKFIKDGVFQGDDYAEEYAKILSQGIDQILSGKWDPREQIEYINSNYGWDTVASKWKDFHDIL